MICKEANIKKENSSIAILPEPAGLFGLITFWALCLLSGQKSLECADTLWHIKVGQVMLNTGKVLDHDIFSHTVPGKQWMAHEWLAEIFMAICYKIAGLSGVAVAFFLAAGLTIILLFKASQRLSNEWSAFFAISIAAAFAQTHLLARPHMFTWLFGALFLYLLIRDNRTLWFLPILTAIWCNLHGGVLLGLVLQGAFLLGRFLDGFLSQKTKDIHALYTPCRRPLYVFLLSLLALGCNPFGYSLLLFPFQVSAEIFSQNIGEWQAPDLQKMWYVRVWLIILATFLAYHGRKTTWAWRLLLVFFIYQALGHIRHISIAAMFLAPWTAMSLRDCCSGLLKNKKKLEEGISLSTWSGPTLMVVSFVLLFTICAVNPIWWKAFAAKNFALPDSDARSAIDYLQTHGYPGEHLLNEYTLGGFLLFSLDPPPKVFIDGRADMYGEKVFSDYKKLTNLDQDIDQILAEYKIDWILYPRDSLLVRYMENKPGWTNLYSDDLVAILSKKK